MRVDRKRDSSSFITAPSKLNPNISYRYPIVKHERRQRADNTDLCRKILNEPSPHFSGESLSLQSMDAINVEEVPNTSNEIKHSGGKYDTSKSDVIQQLEYASRKYKNPHTVSINSCIDYKKSTHLLENILKEDESPEGKRSILFNCREYLAAYQESFGTPRTEYSFAALIVVMAQATARSLLALIYVIVNIIPVIQMFSFILRFVLDKIIDIRRTKNVQQIMVKLTIFVVQLLSVYVCLIFILGFIVLPIIRMGIAIVTKFVMRN